MPIISTPSIPGSLDPMDLVQITAAGVSDGQATNNVWYAGVPSLTGSALSGSAAIDEMNHLAEAMHAWYGGWLNFASSSLHFKEFRSKKVLTHSVIGGKGKFTFDIQGLDLTDVAGTLSPPNAPTFVAVTVGLVTGDSGRHFRGSKRFGGVIEDDTDFDELTSAALALWETEAATRYADWDLAVSGAGCTLAWKLVVPAVSKTPPAADQTEYSAITVYRVNSILGSQVSRKRKRYAA